MVHGYPPLFILIVLGAGIPLAIAKPYRGFLLALFIMTAGHVMRFNQTRIAGLGPYFNLTDACMLIAFAAFFFDKLRKTEPIVLPQIVPLMLFVVAIAAVQSFWKLGWTYETMRACRWAMQTPAVYFLGANMVTSESRVRRLIRTLLAACLLAGIQHVLLAATIWREASLTMETYYGMRTIGFWAGCMPPAFLIATSLGRAPIGIARNTTHLIVTSLFLTSLFLNQTRSLWLAAVASVPCVMILLRIRLRPTRIATLCLSCIVVVTMLYWSCKYLMPGLDVFTVIMDRGVQLIGQHTHVATRERAFLAEMGSWAEGTLLFGRGLFFFQAIANKLVASKYIAFGHLGYVTYLSQLGLIGFLVYGVALPLGILRNSARLWWTTKSPSLQYLALLGGASIVCLSIMFAGSSHFLAPGYEAPGVLYGAMWGGVGRLRMGSRLVADPAVTWNPAPQIVPNIQA